MITKKIIEHIEGEASIRFQLKNGLVRHATIAFPHFRGMEHILEGKNALDALVITPRVCGICGHAHLMATVRALEDIYKNAGYEIALTKKAQTIRELTLVLEIIQNHFKWIYMVIYPQLLKLTNTNKKATSLKGAYGAQIATKVLAIFAGQWPHSSYMIPGGITSDVTYMELTKAKNYLKQLQDFFEKECLGETLENFLAFDSCKDFNNLLGDFSTIEQMLISLEMQHKGLAEDKFLTLGVHEFSSAKKLKATKAYKADSKYVTTEDAVVDKYSKTFAKNALYKKQFFETGPLARLMANEEKLIKNIHRRYKDSTYTRVIARMYECAKLLHHANSLLADIDISQPSCIDIPNIKDMTALGVGVVEAPRGPLIHKINIENGMIQNYQITTPTQFNISSGTREMPSPAQKAMQNVGVEEAEFIFRSFDVCSVCTTH